MKLRDLILRISGVALGTIILTITFLAVAYKLPKKYTYVKDDKFGRSKNCYIDEKDYRVCETKKGLIRVEMFYEEEE